MILPWDKTRRDSEIFQFSPKSLQGHIVSNHILFKIGELFKRLFQQPFTLDSKKLNMNTKIKTL